MADVQQQEVPQLLQRAQTVLEDGQHRETIAACQHVLAHYPDAITALRLLGEALLEVGRPDDATRTFEKVLHAEPYNVLARVGLGVIAEDRGEDERAIAQFRLAWEVEPTLPQLRSELVRLYRKRYGVGGRLRMTRIALANLHAQNDNLLRACRQFALLHQEDPRRLDVSLGWAVALWRHGDDAAAIQICQQLLTEHPRLVRALLILAAIAGDGGAVAERVGKTCEEILAIAEELDPDRALARHLAAYRTSPTLESFCARPATIPTFDPAHSTLAGTDELLSLHLGGDVAREDTWDAVAGSWATSAGGATGTNGTAAAGSYLDDDVDALFAAIDRQLTQPQPAQPDIPAGVDPVDLDGIEAATDTPETAEEPRAAWDAPEDDLMMPAPDEPTAVERLTANWDNIDNELAAARPTDDAVPTTAMLSAVGLDFQPFDVEAAVEVDTDGGITFDPAKFSLPPLDDDEDEDTPEDELGVDQLGLDVSPLSLDDVGGKVKTSGLTFADLVERERAATPEAGWTKLLGAEPEDEREIDTSPITDAASIFATRDLASLPEDRLLELGITPPEAAATAATIPASEPAAAEQPASPLIEVPVSPLAAVDALLSADAPHLVLPESNIAVGETRPLLTDEALAFGLPATPADRATGIFATVPGASDEGGLFSRLRQRRHDRIQSSDLLDANAVAEPAQAVAWGEELVVQEDLVVAAAVKAEPAVAPVEPAPGDDWLAGIGVASPASAAAAPAVALVESASEPVDATTETPADDWLNGLVHGATGETPEQEAHGVPVAGDAFPAWPAAATGAWTNGEAQSFDVLAGGEPAPGEPRQAWEASGDVPVSQELVPWEAVTLAPHTPEDVRLDLGTIAPEQPAPASAAALAPAARPRWGGEVPDEVRPAPAAPDPVVAPTPASRNGRPDVAPIPAMPPSAAIAAPARALPEPLPAPFAPAANNGTARDHLGTLEALVAAEPQNHFARLTLAVAYSTDRPEQALHEYRRLIKESDELVPEVIERLKEMIADGEAPPRAHRVLGDAYMKLGQYDLAMAEFQRALTARARPGR